jgi:putative membrane protein
MIMTSQTVLATLALAAADSTVESSGGSLLFNHILAALIFAAVGLVAFCASLWVISKITPFSIRKEIEEDQNTSLAIIIGAMIIGMSIIIAAAIV